VVKIRKEDNYLDLIPYHNRSLGWTLKDDGCVQILIPRMGITDRIVRLFKKTPEQMHVDLDEIGSTVWKLMDKSRSIGDICDIMNEQYGDAVHPVYERLGTYINILRNNKFIELEKNQGGK